MSTAPATPLFFADAAAFGAWLAAHAADAPALIVGFHKLTSGLPSMSWPQAVDEALCVGWIDGVRTRIDAQSYKIRFTPRKASSTWSAINIERVRVLQAEGRMRQAGLAAFARRSVGNSKIYAYEQAAHAVLPPQDELQFRKHKAAWAFFEAQSASYRHRVVWQIISAKRVQTQQSRLAKLIEASHNGQRL